MAVESVSVDAKLIGDDAAIALFKLMRVRSRDLRAVFDEFGDYYAAFHFFRFARSGQFIGTKRWAPLNPKYKARKTATYGARPILTATGALAASLNHRPFDVDRISFQRAEFGTKVDYARFHQTGTRFMPKRAIIVPLTKAQMKLLEKIVADHILPMDIVRLVRGAAT